jgi:hypothetical protein
MKPLREITGPLPFGTHPGRQDQTEPRPQQTIPRKEKFNLQKKTKLRKKIITGIDVHPILTQSQFDQLSAAAQTLKRRMKKTEKQIRLPHDLGGTFPNRNESIETRWQQVRFLTEYLASIRREKNKDKIDAVMHTIRREELI